MGVILDSSVVIGAERAGLTPADLIRQTMAQLGDRPVALSAIGYAEVAHGIYRAKSEKQRQARRLFVEGLLAQLGVYPFTREAAELAARIGAEAVTAGNAVPVADLFIGATALSLGYAVLTSNDRHFRLVPGLTVISFKQRASTGPKE
ncbi:MAG TPA: PIN domain-containing protein [Acidobacteriaceae bacterium]|nr:PIN domain-containing protein [Acidobacteriaceae bacterium]